MSSRSLPRVQMIDELLMKWKRADESLKRIRDVVVAHDKAMDMERQDVGRNGEHGYNYSNDLHNEAKLYENGDHKKRRGVRQALQMIRCIDTDINLARRSSRSLP